MDPIVPYPYGGYDLPYSSDCEGGDSPTFVEVFEKNVNRQSFALDDMGERDRYRWFRISEFQSALGSVLLKHLSRHRRQTVMIGLGPVNELRMYDAIDD